MGCDRRRRRSHGPLWWAASPLLRARRERPCRRAAEQRDERAPAFHSITSSARREQARRAINPERLRGLEIDESARSCRIAGRADRQAYRLSESAGVNAHPAVGVCETASIAHEPSCDANSRNWIDRGHRVADSERGEVSVRLLRNPSVAMTRAPSAQCEPRSAKAVLEIALGTGAQDMELDPQRCGPPPGGLARASLKKASRIDEGG